MIIQMQLVVEDVKNFSEYKYLTGVIAGLAIVERDLLDLVEIAEQ